MELKKIKISDLKTDDKFLLSYPLRPEIYGELKKRLSPLPFIVIDKHNEIVFGRDCYEYLRSLDKDGEIEALQGDFTGKEALFLNYNLKNKSWGLNLYEKLIFVKKVIGLTAARDNRDLAALSPEADAAARAGAEGKNRLVIIAEIYEKTDLDIDIDNALLDKLEIVTGSEFVELLTQDKIALKSALKLCDFAGADRGCLSALFLRVHFTASQQLQLLEMTEEILFRDKTSLAGIFEKLNLEDLLRLEKPQKIIIGEIFKYRFPAYAAREQEWRKEIKELKLPANIKVAHYPFFEKKGVDIHIAAPNLEELKKIIAKIKS